MFPMNIPAFLPFAINSFDFLNTSATLSFSLSASFNSCVMVDLLISRGFSLGAFSILATVFVTLSGETFRLPLDVDTESFEI